MNSINMKYKWVYSFAIVLVSFLLVNIFLFPLFNSGDDVFLMYTLAGGYGDAPTNLVHYNHIWHPALGWIVKTLYKLYLNINWYAILLLVLQVIGFSAILYVLFRKFQWRSALMLFLVLFFFFEVRILLSLNFSSTSWVLGTAGLFLLMDTVRRDTARVNLFVACLLLMLAGLLRLQIFIAVTFLFLPCFLIYARKAYKKWIPALLGVSCMLFLLNLQHQHYYKLHISGWEKQEEFRQSLFYAYNRPLDKTKPLSEIFIDSTEAAFYYNNFFFDTTVISSERVKQIGKSLVRNRNFSISEDYEILYWLFIEIRVYLLLFFICLFIIWQMGLLKRVLKLFLLPALFLIVVYLSLVLTMKMTEAIHLGMLIILSLYFILALSEVKLNFTPVPSFFFISSLLLLLPLFWIGIRIMKKDKDNRKRHELFLFIMPEIKKNSDKLFIATDDTTPLSFFYIWDSPSKYALYNFIYKDRIIHQAYIPTLQRFGITDIMQAIYQNPNVFLLGRDFPELKKYYLQKKNLNVSITPTLSDYQYIKVRKVFEPSASEYLLKH